MKQPLNEVVHSWQRTCGDLRLREVMMDPSADKGKGQEESLVGYWVDMKRCSTDSADSVGVSFICTEMSS
ncbi:Uncharacterized protein DAT39_021557 [Clarias magur]|uniref:Uncharacterized protein n=1 Tax=Clarias magur TaxID=1594786 RepID=A0A8J4T524_CLAMG|nr:Uncharacterized protein DAT39_021557 [Clarias magur]